VSETNLYCFEMPFSSEGSKWSNTTYNENARFKKTKLYNNGNVIYLSKEKEDLTIKQKTIITLNPIVANKLLCVCVCNIKLLITSTLGCPTLHDMHQIAPSTNYVIPTWFSLFVEFSCIIFCFAACGKNKKDFPNLWRKNVPDALFNYFILKQFLRPNWNNMM
jgi:hypothetical protein